jgi:hypothetical protein
MSNSLIHLFKLFKYELEHVRNRSTNFSLWLHLNLWFKDRILRKSPMESAFPWINYSTIQFMHHIVSKETKVLEFGAGGSSLFFLERKTNLISIEHEAEWINEVQKRASQKQLMRWSHHLISSNKPNSRIPLADDYLYPLKNIVDSSIDLVVVDGRHRVESIKRSMTKVKPGGCLILDNSDRPEYAEAFVILLNWELLEKWSITNCSEFVTPAAIWTKPSIA